MQKYLDQQILDVIDSIMITNDIKVLYLQLLDNFNCQLNIRERNTEVTDAIHYYESLMHKLKHI